MTAECLRHTSRCCAYNSSLIPACKNTNCDHLHLPCQYYQSQPSCRVRKREAHTVFCASECQNEHVLRRSYSCDRKAAHHHCDNETRTPRLCCSNCCPCLNCPSKCQVTPGGEFYSHRYFHCICCCEFHQCGLHGKGATWARGPIAEAFMGY